MIVWAQSGAREDLLLSTLIPSPFSRPLFPLVPEEERSGDVERTCSSSCCSRGDSAYGPTNFPPSNSILLSSPRFPPSRRSGNAFSASLHEPRRVSSPLRGGNSVGGKVIRPLATKSFPADSCFIIPRLTSTYAGAPIALWFFVSFFPSLPYLPSRFPHLLWPLPFIALPLVRRIDALLASEKSRWTRRTRAGHAGDVVAN